MELEVFCTSGLTLLVLTPTLKTLFANENLEGVVITAIENIKRGTITVIAALTVFVSFAPVASADKYDDQINALKEQANQQQAKANEYRQQADTLANKMDGLQAQISSLESQIAANNARNRKLNLQITSAKVKMAEQKEVLGESVKQMYLNSTVSPLEMLASSSNISEFLDKQQYQDKVKDTIQEAMSEIEKLRLALEKQQKEVQILLANQKNMQYALGVQKQEAAALLAQTQGEEAKYQEQVKASSSQIASLRSQQSAAIAAASRRVGGGSFPGRSSGAGGSCDKGFGNGGYPMRWCNAPLDAYVDSWGMYSRECVSYTAWKVASTGRNMPYWGGVGHAYQWPGNARRAGIPVSVGGGARVGDIAIFSGGPFGHAMYVEQVKGGSVIVSEFNRDWDGKFTYSEWPQSALSFIHF